MSQNTVKFSNPDCLPVEDVMISIDNDGVVRKIKALDPHWVEQRNLVVYVSPPPSNSSILGAVETWTSDMEVYLEDLKWLLALEYHKFWSTVLYHPQCMDTLVSFLQEATPPYMPPHTDSHVQTLYNDIRRNVLVVFSRLITNKESKTQWMTKEYMSSVIYDNFIFTIPVLWDICLVYGLDNKRHISRLVTSVLGLQPQYLGDAKAAVAFVNEALKYIILQVNKNYDSLEPPNLPESFKGFGDIHKPSSSSAPMESITITILKDLVIHLLDTAMTLRIFLEVYPKAVSIFRETKFVNSIVQMYEYGIPQLYKKLIDLAGDNKDVYYELERYIDMARAELIDVFREILSVYMNVIFSGDNEASQVEEYLSVLMDVLQEKLFIRDYQTCYPIHEDIELLRQACPDIDSVKVDFILQAIYSNIEEPLPEYLLSTNQELPNGHLETIDNVETYSKTTDNTKEEIDQEALISEVRDILPELGDGFILQCLKHYGFNKETVMNSILENNLHESLRNLDRTMPIIPEDPLDKLFLETGVARLNVFDGDEFDILSRDKVDTSRIHRGKRRSKYKNLSDMLDDKTEVRQMADVYEKYTLVCDEVDLYSDEYDDAYDVEEPPRPADTTDEVRPFVTPRALRDTQRRVQVESSSSSSEEEPQPGSSKNKLDFCVNPEEIRAKREAAWQARRGKGHHRPPPARNTDVTGKPKGQGQEKEVLHNRDKKEKHKSSRSNHSRRQGAQWKRGQGMMPS